MKTEIPGKELPEIIPAAPHGWLTPAVARRQLIAHAPVSRDDYTGSQCALIDLLEDADEDPAIWPARVASLSRRGLFWTIAATAISDGESVSDEDTAKIKTLRGRGLL